MTLRKVKIMVVLVAALVAAPAQSVKAQADAMVESYKFDFGGGVGLSTYLGDANEGGLFSHPGFAANIAARYIINSRWALRAQMSMASLSGNSADSDNMLPDGAQYEFSSTAYDLGVRGECNFFAYGMGETYKRLRRWTPFLAVGIGATLASTDGSSSFAMNIPMSIGVKFKLKKRLNIIAEFTMTKVFGDNVDSDELSDLYGIESSFGKNTDWYSSFTVGVSYEFGARCSTCHRID